jgi:hypothetical protein
MATTSQRFCAGKLSCEVISRVCNARSVRGTLQHDLKHGNGLMQIALAKVRPRALILRKHDHLHAELEQLFEHHGVEESAIVLIAGYDRIVQNDESSFLIHGPREK